MPPLISAVLAVALAAPSVAVPGPRAAVARLQASQPAARVIWQGDHARLLTGLNVTTEGATAADRVAGFLRQHPNLVGLPGALRPLAVQHRNGRTTVQLTQAHQGVPVLDHGLTVTLNAQGAVISLTNDTVRLQHVAAATIDEARALALAVEATGLQTPMTARAVVLALGDAGVEGFEVNAGLMVVRIDAHAGTVIGMRKGWMD